MKTYTLEISTMSMAGEPQRSYNAIVKANSPKEAAEMAHLTFMERSAKVVVYETNPESVGEFWIERRVSVTTEVVAG